MLTKVDRLVKELSAEVEHIRLVVAPRGLEHLLWSAAAAFVAEAKQRGALDLDLAEAFKGMVLYEAVRQAESTDESEALKEAFVLVGKSQVVRARNQCATWDREERKLEELRAVLADPAATKAADRGKAPPNNTQRGTPADG